KKGHAKKASDGGGPHVNDDKNLDEAQFEEHGALDVSLGEVQLDDAAPRKNESESESESESEKEDEKQEDDGKQEDNDDDEDDDDEEEDDDDDTDSSWTESFSYTTNTSTMDEGISEEEADLDPELFGLGRSVMGLTDDLYLSSQS
ncbi:hypothetical protein GR268_46580, partial [Rhizobium leguminosarum]|nr:hypothetical protein [Rhizobium leguminosarum]